MKEIKEEVSHKLYILAENRKLLEVSEAQNSSGHDLNKSPVTFRAPVGPQNSGFHYLQFLVSVGGPETEHLQIRRLHLYTIYCFSNKKLPRHFMYEGNKMVPCLL